MKDKDIEQKVLIQLAKRSNCNWKPFAEWAKEVKVDFESIVPSMSVVDLEKMVKVGQDGIWERETECTIFFARRAMREPISSPACS